MVASLVDAPNQTSTYDGATIVSQVEAYAESVAHRAGLRHLRPLRHRAARAAATRRRTPASTTSSRVSERSAALIDTVGPGTTDKLLAELAAGTRVSRRPGRAGQVRRDGHADRRHRRTRR